MRVEGNRRKVDELSGGKLALNPRRKPIRSSQRDYLNTFKSPNYKENSRKFRGEIPGSKDEPEKFLKDLRNNVYK